MAQDENEASVTPKRVRNFYLKRLDSVAGQSMAHRPPLRE